MKRSVGELAMALLVLGIGGLALFGASQHPYYTEFGPDAGFFPFWVGLAETLIGAALLIQWLRASASDREAEEDSTSRRRQLTAAGLLVGYIVLLHLAGFFAASVLFLVAIMVIVEQRPWMQSMAVSIALSLALLGLFGYAFDIPLPQGLFGDF